MRAPREFWSRFMRPTAMVAVVLTTAGLMSGAKLPDQFEVGVIGKIKKLEEDRKSFSIRARGLKKTRVFIDSKTEFFKFEVTLLDKLKDGTDVNLLGIHQPSVQNVPSQYVAIKTMYSGKYSDIQPLPEKEAKVRGLEWHSGSLKDEGREKSVNGNKLATSPKTQVVQISTTNVNMLKDNTVLYVFGVYNKKEDGEKENKLTAKKIILFDPKFKKDEYHYYFKLGVVKPKTDKDDSF